MPAPVVAPAGPLAKDGRSVTVFNANVASNWTATGGTFTGAVNGTVIATWTAPNVSGTYKVRATNPVDNMFTEITVTVMAIVPNTWEFKSPGQETKDVLIFKPQAGPTQTRSLSDWYSTWDIGAEDASYDEFQEMRAFIKAHYPGKIVALDDPVVRERRFFKFTAPFNKAYNPGDGFAWNSKIEEQWPYTVVML